MTRFEWCVERVLAAEGGLADDPDDLGGLTRWGVSQRSYPLLDIANLTRDEAITIYKRDFWDVCHADQMPEPLDFYLFDCAVNQGQGTAVRLLQEAVGAHVDGWIGPETLAAVRRPEAAAKFMSKRARRYMTRGTFWKYGDGWLKRLFIVAEVA